MITIRPSTKKQYAFVSRTRKAGTAARLSVQKIEQALRLRKAARCQ